MASASTGSVVCLAHVLLAGNDRRILVMGELARCGSEHCVFSIQCAKLINRCQHVAVEVR
jgi:hypothetical protein